MYIGRKRLLIKVNLIVCTCSFPGTVKICNISYNGKDLMRSMQCVRKQIPLSSIKIQREQKILYCIEETI